MYNRIELLFPVLAVAFVTSAGITGNRPTRGSTQGKDETLLFYVNPLPRCKTDHQSGERELW